MTTAAQPNGNGHHLPDELLLGRLQQLVANAFTSRVDLFRRTAGQMDPRRSIDDECGFPATSAITAELLQEMYDRNPIAARVVDIWPEEAWQVQPRVYSSEDADTVTPFEEGWDALSSHLYGEESHYLDESGGLVWDYFKRGNIESRVGRYGVLFLGFDDGLDYREPCVKAGRLLFVRALPEALATVARYEDNPRSRRFGQPVLYSLTFNDPRDGSGSNVTTAEVHWTRVIHIAEGDGTHVPPMRWVWNNLLSLNKVYGGDAEAVWRNAVIKMFFETLPQANGMPPIVDWAGLKDRVEAMMNGLQQWMGLENLTVKSILPALSDPTAHVNVQIEAICVRLAVPVPVFKGYEIGEQASTNNNTNWTRRVQGYQRTHCTPRIVVPFIDRLIRVGVLPKPAATEGVLANARKRGHRVRPARGGWLVVNDAGRQQYVAKGGYCVEWPEMVVQTEAERLSLLLQRTQAYAAYISGQVESLIPPLDYMTRFDGMDEEEAQAVLDSAAGAVPDDTLTGGPEEEQAPGAEPAAGEGPAA